MRVEPLHAWPQSIQDARALQERLRNNVTTSRLKMVPRAVAGVAVESDHGDERLFVAVVVVDASTFAVLDQATHVRVPEFPILPGFRSFRDVPPIVEAFKRLKHTPDVVMINRQGFAHPMRFGVACHLGLWLRLPTVGCAPTLLTGAPQPLPQTQGAMAPILDEDTGEMLSMGIRTRADAEPMFVSVGHQITLPEAGALVLAQSMGRRMPMAMKLAHMAAIKLRHSVKGLDPEMAALLKRGV